jgi:hypothetical protein
MRRLVSFFVSLSFCAVLFGQQPQNGNASGWYADREEVLHSPVSGVQSVPLASVEADQYVITTDVKWLAGQQPAGGGADICVDIKNSSDNQKYRFRLHNPQNDPAGQTATAKGSVFSIEKQTTAAPIGGSWESVASAVAKPGQADKADTWHNLFITVSGKSVSVKWDDATVLTFSGLEGTATKNDVVLGTNHMAAQYKNVQVSSIDRFLVYMSGIPETVATPK